MSVEFHPQNFGKRIIFQDISFNLTLGEVVERRQWLRDEVQVFSEMVSNPDSIVPKAQSLSNLDSFQQTLTEFEKYSDKELLNLLEIFFNRAKGLEMDFQGDYNQIVPILFEEFPGINLIKIPFTYLPMPEHSQNWAHEFGHAVQTFLGFFGNVSG